MKKNKLFLFFIMFLILFVAGLSELQAQSKSKQPIVQNKKQQSVKKKETKPSNEEKNTGESLFDKIDKNKELQSKVKTSSSTDAVSAQKSEEVNKDSEKTVPNQDDKVIEQVKENENEKNNQVVTQAITIKEPIKENEKNSIKQEEAISSEAEKNTILTSDKDSVPEKNERTNLENSIKKEKITDKQNKSDTEVVEKENKTEIKVESNESWLKYVVFAEFLLIIVLFVLLFKSKKELKEAFEADNIISIINKKIEDKITGKLNPELFKISNILEEHEEQLKSKTKPTEKSNELEKRLSEEALAKKLDKAEYDKNIRDILKQISKENEKIKGLIQEHDDSIKQLQEDIDNNKENIGRNKDEIGKINKDLERNYVEDKQSDLENEKKLSSVENSLNDKVISLEKRFSEFDRKLNSKIYGADLVGLKNAFNDLNVKVKKVLTSNSESNWWFNVLVNKDKFQPDVSNEITTNYESLKNKDELKDFNNFYNYYNTFVSVKNKISELDKKVIDCKIDTDEYSRIDFENDINECMGKIQSISVLPKLEIDDWGKKAILSSRDKVISKYFDINKDNFDEASIKLLNVELIMPNIGEIFDDTFQIVTYKDNFDENLPNNAICKISKIGYKDNLTGKITKAQVMINKA